MKSRPTIALTMIVKNEAHNLGPLFESIQGCFDQIHIADTGSTDNTVELLQSEKIKELAGCPVHVHHFEWCNDFAAARQYCLDQVPKTMDYIMWMDGDDVLSDRDAFKHFRDHSMHCAHMWLINYNYAFENGRSVCTFYRERIVKHNNGFKWHFFLHEGLIHDGSSKLHTQFCPTFTINHMRTKSDEKADRSRNIKIFMNQMKKGAELQPRMHYYFGKELFDDGQYAKAVEILQQACEFGPDVNFSLHDRIMAVQFLSMAYARCGKWKQSLSVALNGIQLEPSRAEFLICVADALVHLGKVNESKVFYEASKHCGAGDAGGAIYSSPISKDIYPASRLAEIYLNECNVAGAERELSILKSVGYPTEHYESQLNLIKQKNEVPSVEELVHVDEIVITTPPGTVTKNWDEYELDKNGLGGSETACVEIARQLQKQTRYNVKVFMNRPTRDIMPSGVEYIPLADLEDYFKKYKPARHIAWRHTHKLTPALSYVWSHDLITINADRTDRYDKLWCLTEFHKHFMIDMLGIDAEKIDIVRNGIDAALFEVNAERNPNKVIFSSSPDRGWVQSVEICKRAREKNPNIELHLFYGTQNMRKMGMDDYANQLDDLVRQHDWVHFHGFVSKPELVRHFKESAVWLYPADFIETSCITAMEAMCAGAYPLVRNMGALKYTLAEAIEKGFCTILDEEPAGEENYQKWSDALNYALDHSLWKKVTVDPKSYSWETVTNDYIQSMNLC